MREESVYSFSGSGHASVTAESDGCDVRLVTSGHAMSLVHNMTPEVARALATELLNAADSAARSKASREKEG